MPSERLNMRSLAQRLEQLEGERAVRACIARYMQLCDELGPGSELTELAQLFTEDVVWEGVGDRYRDLFGCVQGRDAVLTMFAKYTRAPAHFRINAHFLSSERIAGGEGGYAQGTWTMLQTSSFADGKSYLAAARLQVDFRAEGSHWRIAHFRTASLFSRPVTRWDGEVPMPVPR